MPFSHRAERALRNGSAGRTAVRSGASFRFITHSWLGALQARTLACFRHEPIIIFSRGSSVSRISDVRRPAAVNMLPIGGDRDGNRCNKSPEEDQESVFDQALGILKKRRRTDSDKSHKEP